MTEHKFTDEEIKKALDCCINDDCDNCPNDFGNCYSNLAGYALNLINRQREEIEVIKETTAEIRYEAIKELAERLKTYYRNLDRTAGGLVEYHIDQIAKEMLEGG